MFGKKDVRLMGKQVKDLMKNMSKSECQEFERRQREAESDRFWDVMNMNMSPLSQRSPSMLALSLG